MASGGTGNGGATAGAASGGAVNLFVDQIRGREGCLPRALPVVATPSDGFTAGQVRCQIDEATFPVAPAACSCDYAQHLKPAAASLVKAIASNVAVSGSCDGTSGVDCQSLCVCELEQSSGDALTQCQTDTTPIAQLPPGFCYLDVTLVPPLGNPALLASCPQSQRRGLRILGPTPTPAPLLFLACAGTM
jgi:hypothetical protein